jgi:NAD(P)-dependent dehydrogenase (short-subunit alcohol dehydrogenase family)
MVVIQYQRSINVKPTKQVALVTGASSGIGRSTALALINAGFEVVGTSRNSTGHTDHDGVTLIALDVGDDESAKAAVQQVMDRFGRLDVLVNNAGIGSTGAAEERSLAEDERVFNINVFGPIRMAKAALPHMRAQGKGRIINISSVLGIIPAPYMAAYAASKHAIEGYTESLDHEIREFGIRALIVQPAYTKTSFEANALPPEAPLPLYAERQGASTESWRRRSRVANCAASRPQGLRQTDPQAQPHPKLVP